MEQKEFEQEYDRIFTRSLALAEKARREGLLSLDSDIDGEALKKRELYALGLRLIVDGTDIEIVNAVLTNIINQEKDPEQKILKAIIREAVIDIQQGMGPRPLALLLNSYVSIRTAEAVAAYLEYGTAATEKGIF